MIPKLEMLIALAREKHFGRAAESLGITQPTLSTGIRQLEEQLGVKLVIRGSRFGGLTPEGQRALIRARQIVGDTRRLREEMRASREGLAGHLRLAVIPTALTWASRLVTGFTDRHPNVSFTVLSRASVEILSMLDDLEIDVGISYLDNEPLGRVTTRPLYREAYTLVCRPDHALAKGGPLSWDALGEARLCLLTPDMQNRRIINRHFMEAGVGPSALIESNSTVVLVANVLHGDWVTILPDDLARFLCDGKPLAVVPLRERGTAPTVGLIAPHQEPYTPVLQALLRETEGLARPAR
ncbi:MAG: LysR family transcriptional regulator [Salipiger thiooxidans]|uniref:LysR family transcriptional regulator n=1 Tax=Salipiger thiooxidans TaxID=282683 RepID=UPI001CFA1338|nr:LysR family transcriptional regulator [Salipiger thiooxidans]